MNLLATKWGRLLTFFLLYITEGIPLGFTATAMAIQMRSHGMSPKKVGLFTASLYLPWAWKWAAGPFVDLIYSNRLGRRRAWIVSTQLLMVVSLMACMPFDLVAQLSTVTAILILHNSCCAVQDVAIDALACESLRSDERGLGNGLMFAGQALGETIGGAGVLFMMSFLAGPPNARRMDPDAAFQLTYWFVAACLIVVTICVAVPLKEHPLLRASSGESPVRQAFSELRKYIVTAGRSFVGSQTAFVGLVIACLPSGAIALSSALRNNVSVELKFSLDDLANLALYSTIIQAAGCLLGGIVSDLLGRRKTLALFIVLCSAPTVWLAIGMQEHGWIMPLKTTEEAAQAEGSDDPSQKTEASPRSASEESQPTSETATTHPNPPKELVNLFWGCVLFYALTYGLLIGSQIPVFMEITNPAVAATQFTAYMALHNLVTSYSMAWQGYSISLWGYPTTLWLDAAFGLVGIALFPFLKLQKRTEEEVATQRDADLGHPV